MAYDPATYDYEKLANYFNLYQNNQFDQLPKTKWVKGTRWRESEYNIQRFTIAKILVYHLEINIYTNVQDTLAILENIKAVYEPHPVVPIRFDYETFRIFRDDFLFSLRSVVLRHHLGTELKNLPFNQQEEIAMAIHLYRSELTTQLKRKP